MLTQLQSYHSALCGGFESVRRGLRYTADWRKGERMNNRLQSHSAQRERQATPPDQHRLFRRNQAIGLLLVAAAVLAWRLTQTPAGWLFPPGWWRLW
jgi:ferric-dicitrate binding protein FerR (iron transport regulator)